MTEFSNQLVSVVIPTYNRPSSLRRALDSVFEQSYNPVEVIVVDDGSETDTQAVIDEYSNKRLTFFEHETNKNASAARNTGINHSNGDYIALLDDDDEWIPTKLERQVSDLESRSEEIVATYCDIKRQRDNRLFEFVDQTFERPKGVEGDQKVIEAILSQRLDFGGNSTLLIEREALEKIDGFDESFNRYQDREMLLRLLQIGKIGFLNEKLVLRHSTGRSDLETALQAQKRYFEKFDNLITEFELQGVPVHATHNFTIARKRFSRGEFIRGAKILMQSEPPHLRDIFGLGLDVGQGIKSKINLTF